MDECFSKYYCLNGSLRSAETFNNSLIYEGESIYEVLRMVDGLPVFFNEHAKRLEISVRMQGKIMLSDNISMRRDVLALARTEKMKQVNLKIVFNYNRDVSNCLVYYIEALYPTPEQYETGVRGVLFHAVRNDPGSKIINHRLRSEIFHKLIIENGYEALLVNRNNCITEGSRSNIFFLAENRLITSPDSLILNGITRRQLLEICWEMNIEVVFDCVNADTISDYESVIMTGTSPVVLPFHSINDVKFNVKHPLIDELRNQYLKRAEESRRRFQDIVYL